MRFHAGGPLFALLCLMPLQIPLLRAILRRTECRDERYEYAARVTTVGFWIIISQVNQSMA